MIDYFPVHTLGSRTVFTEGFSDVAVFTKMVKDFTGVSLKIKKVENDKAFFKSVGDVKVEFDLFAEDEDNRIVVEAQHANYTQNFERFYYYHQVATVETIKSSRDYSFPKTVYTLVFFTNRHSPVLGKNILVHDAEMKYLVDGKVIKGIFPCKHRLFFIFVKDPEGDTLIPEECQEWIKAIHETLRGSVCLDDFEKPEILTLFKRIEKDKLPPETRAKMMLEYSQQDAIEDAVNDAVNENNLETAVKMIKHNSQVTDSYVSDITGLPEKKIQALREEMDSEY
jgi:hypothetical protein